MMAKEIMLLLENLDQITSVIKSDHILNLFQDLDGKLPRDKEQMLIILRDFLAMDPRRQCLYQVGRRIGVFSGLNDMESRARLARAEKTCNELEITPANVDEITDELMKSFIS